MPIRLPHIRRGCAALTISDRTRARRRGPPASQRASRSSTCLPGPSARSCPAHARGASASSGRAHAAAAAGGFEAGGAGQQALDLAQFARHRR